MRNNLNQRINQSLRTVPDFPKKGIQFKDISPIFQDAALCKDIITYFAEQATGKVDVVCGIESRGFIFGLPVALELNIPFVLIRKKGKLPPPTIGVAYDLEYGSAELEVVEKQITPGQRVMIHDDILATGGTANACAKLINQLGGKVVQFSFLLELSELNGRQKLASKEVVCINSI